MSGGMSELKPGQRESIELSRIDITFREFIPIGYGLAFTMGIILSQATVRDKRKAWDVRKHPFARRNRGMRLGIVGNWKVVGG